MFGLLRDSTQISLERPVLPLLRVGVGGQKRERWDLVCNIIQHTKLRRKLKRLFT